MFNSSDAHAVAPIPSQTTPRAVWLVAAATFVLVYAFAARYGYFRDELYYLACGQHPAWGYVDEPPLIAWTAWLLEHTIGTSLFALRLLSALCAPLSVWLTARLARELGGSARAELVAAVLMAVMPVALLTFHLFTMNAFDFPLWTALALLLVRIENSGESRLWLLFGLLAGVTVLNKYGVIFFLAALLAGTLCTAWRRLLRCRWFWAGTLIAVLIALPNFLWQQQRHFPFLQLMANVRHSGRDVSLPPLGFFFQQMQMVNPAAMLAVLAGLVWLLSRRRYRAFGIAFLVFYAALMLLRAKSYYLSPIYPVLFAAGAVALTEWSSARPRLLAPAIATLALLITLVGLPLVVPVLTVSQFQQYTRLTGIKLPEFEHHRPSPLPQIYADMFGWPEMVEKVARFYNSLPPEQRQQTAIYGDNYGVAAAIDFFGPRYGLPPAISGHQSYFLWGTHGFRRGNVINVGSHDDLTLRRECDAVTVIGRADHPLSRGDEHFDIYFCQGLNFDATEKWDHAKRWD